MLRHCWKMYKAIHYIIIINYSGEIIRFSATGIQVSEIYIRLRLTRQIGER